MTRLRFTLPPMQVTHAGPRERLKSMTKNPDGTTTATMEAIGYFVTMRTPSQHDISFQLGNAPGDMPISGMICTLTLEFQEPIDVKPDQEHT